MLEEAKTSFGVQQAVVYLAPLMSLPFSYTIVFVGIQILLQISLH
jgi:hypothetical protein